MDEELKKLAQGEYCGAGYFRAKGFPKGKPAPIIHAPELVKRLLDRINELEGNSILCMDCDVPITITQVQNDGDCISFVGECPECGMTHDGTMDKVGEDE